MDCDALRVPMSRKMLQWRGFCFCGGAVKNTMLFSLALALAGASAASASTIYGFSGTWDIPFPPVSGSGTFTLTVATPPLLDTIYTPGVQLTCSSCAQVELIPDTVAAGFTPPGTPAQAILYTTAAGDFPFTSRQVLLRRLARTIPSSCRANLTVLCR
jgi:hypothetical protein